MVVQREQSNEEERRIVGIFYSTSNTKINAFCWSNHENDYTRVRFGMIVFRGSGICMLLLMLCVKWNHYHFMKSIVRWYELYYMNIVCECIFKSVHQLNKLLQTQITHYTQFLWTTVVRFRFTHKMSRSFWTINLSVEN